jgi:hypothetical protein
MTQNKSDNIMDMQEKKKYFEGNINMNVKAVEYD